MALEPLEFLLRIRRAAEDEARRNFAASLAEEATASERLHAAETQINREGEIATDLGLGDGAVEAYIAWLPVGRQLAAAARAAYDRATTNVTLARAALSVAHAAAEATTTFLQDRADAADLAVQRRSQAVLDEVAARGPPESADDAL